MAKANHALSNSAQDVETSVTVNNSPIQDYVQSDDQTQPTYKLKITMMTIMTIKLVMRKILTVFNMMPQGCVRGQQ